MTFCSRILLGFFIFSCHVSSVPLCCDDSFSSSLCFKHLDSFKAYQSDIFVDCPSMGTCPVFSCDYAGIMGFGEESHRETVPLLSRHVKGLCYQYDLPLLLFVMIIAWGRFSDIPILRSCFYRSSPIIHRNSAVMYSEHCRVIVFPPNSTFYVRALL